MKKLLVAGMAVGALLLTSCKVQALSSVPLQEPAYAYEIDTWGRNSEVYEFTPKSDPTKSCVMLMLDNGKAMGLQCFEVSK